MLAVCAGVDGGGRDARHDVARALADETEDVELRHHALHHGEDGLVQRHVDHLAQTPVDLAMTQGHQCADHRPQRRNRVTDGNAGAHGRAILEPGDVAQATHGLAHRAEARLFLHGPGLAET